MKTKDFLLIASGLAIGYLVFKKDLFKKKNGALSQVAGGAGEMVAGTGKLIGETTDRVAGAIADAVNPKQSQCEKKWEEFAQTVRPSSQEAFEEMKTEFMSSCLLGK